MDIKDIIRDIKFRLKNGYTFEEGVAFENKWGFHHYDSESLMEKHDDLMLKNEEWENRYHEDGRPAEMFISDEEKHTFYEYHDLRHYLDTPQGKKKRADYNNILKLKRLSFKPLPEFENARVRTKKVSGNLDYTRTYIPAPGVEGRVISQEIIFEKKDRLLNYQSRETFILIWCEFETPFSVINEEGLLAVDCQKHDSDDKEDFHKICEQYNVKRVVYLDAKYRVAFLPDELEII